MEKKLRNRIVIFLIAAGLLAYFLVWVIGRKPAAKIAAVMPTRESLIASINSNGKVEPISPYVLRAQLNTFVTRVLVTEGQKVKKGQLLMELDVNDAAAQLAETRSKLLSAENDLKAAKAGGKVDDAARITSDLAKAEALQNRLQQDHDALTRLAQSQAATKEELEANTQQLTSAKAEVTRLLAVKQEFDQQVGLDVQRGELQIQQILSQMAALEDKVNNGRIDAPADGTLYALGRDASGVPIKAGDYLQVGDLLAEMADLHKIRVRAFIDEPDLGGLEAGEPVVITWDALPNRSWTGTTEVIPKQVVPHGTRSVGELLCSVNNDQLELLPNINVNVRINSKEHKNVLAIPRGAVSYEGGHRYVYVVKDDQLGVGKATLEKREIQVGIADATSIEVLSGLQQGDLVALPGDADLRDGMRVQVVNSNAA
ncbi:MAG TPA: efflux RND transporter periplasmic adaptor subunit [Candidatus Acidoferrum sp.]|nr:efflux RND transporter periplasmic adaptor subunit [Candidatus Acidoferrum sp.]